MVKNNGILINVVNSLVKEGRNLKIEARGYSMFPTIKPGYTVIIKSYNNIEEAATGDIIAWLRDNEITLHRLIHIYESNNIKYFITRGDGALSSDLPVSYNDIIGKAIYLENKNQRWEPDSIIFIPEWKYRINKKRATNIAKLRKLIRKVLRK